MSEILDLKNHFENITVWKKGGQRAPHKPLLALYALGRCIRGGRTSRFFCG